MIGAIESFLSQAGPWSLIVVFVAIVLESSAGLGLIFPGETLALIAGAMAADSFYSPWTAFAVVALAAMTGDLTGFTIGHTKGQAVLARWAFARRQYEAHRERLEYYFDALRRRDCVCRTLRRGRPRFRSLRGRTLGHAHPQVRANRDTRGIGVGRGRSRPRLCSGFQLANRREVAQIARRGNRRSCYLDGADGRVVAGGLPPTDADRRGMESAPYRPLRLRPDSIRGIRPQPLLADAVTLAFILRLDCSR